MLLACCFTLKHIFAKLLAVVRIKPRTIISESDMLTSSMHYFCFWP